MRLAAIIFDLDGTIADSTEMFYDFSREVATDLGLPAPDRETVFHLMRTGQSTLSNILFPTASPERIAQTFRTRGPQWLRRYHQETNPVPGSIEALRALHGSGLTLAIATSSGRDLPFLQRWEVRDLFTAVVGREDVTHQKPSPEVILQCLGRICSLPENVIYVGDSPIDIKAGKAAGTGTVAVLSGVSPRSVLAIEQPDAVLPSIAELPALVTLWR